MSRLRDEDNDRRNPESFVVFGTAFPDQTERDKRAGVSDAGQFVPVWKQEARDENGRRRFHGAFTGGFSAGYFNTVGSKEGWQPSNFVSSRSSRNENKEMRPEDYMDDEDLQSLAGAKKLVATEEFDIIGGTERELAARKKLQEEDAERGGSLGFLSSSIINMIGPPKDSVGIRLLRKLGWKPGQGIGPRMSRQQRSKNKDDEDEDEDDEDEDEHMSDITFAPRDTPIVNFHSKTNGRGLGYDLEKSVPQVAEMRRLRELAKHNGEKSDRSAFGVQGNSTKRAGFGLGTFEDDEDDEDVYGYEDGAQNIHHSLYDPDVDQDDPTPWSSTIKRKKEANDVSKIRSSDGRLPLKGFIYSPESQELGKWYQPPKVPTDFDCQHRSILDDQIDIARPQHGLSSDQRGHILGEKPVHTRSVFDYITPKSKHQLDNTLRFIAEAAKPIDRSKLAGFTIVPKEVATLALKGYMPFSENLKKRARYREYLENMMGKKSLDGQPKTELPIPEGLNYEDATKEMEEFSKSARMYGRVNNMINSRFTSASGSHIEQNSFEGGLQTEAEWRHEKQEKEKEVVEEPEKKLTQEAEAASMKMFGQLTRSILPFYPTKLVCKRFNVRNPHPDHVETNVSATGHSRTQAGSHQALSEDSMDSMLRKRDSATASIPKTIKDDPALAAVIPKPSERSGDPDAPTAPLVVETVQVPEQTVQSELALDYERPSMDIFKSIFENWDDEDEDEDEEKEEEKEAVEDKKSITSGRSATVETRYLTKSSVDEEEDMIGPMPPPPTSIVNAEPTSEPFRPIFNRSNVRDPETGQTPNQYQQHPVILSEEIVVQPFKSRALQERSKRRHISVSDDDDGDDGDRRDRRDRKKAKKHKDSKHSRKHSRSPSPERSSKRDKKKSKKESSRRHDHKHKSSSSSSSSKFLLTFGDEEEEAEWVEKEPVVSSYEFNSSKRSDSSRTSSRPEERKEKQKPRMRAADMW
ncbi:hypothetical protein CLU79DRAFT_756186 [Phycomyces nitens]|nr:hypothetical protein CLU79DRAFT_756186 [Phycomyces nitens]